jgi:hypothetical protein
MSDQLPPHIGRMTDAETGYALVCTHEQDGALCGAPARWHIIWTEDVEHGHACDAHKHQAYAHDPVEIHSNTDSACGMPGSYWLREEHRCAMDLLGEEPAIAAAQEVVSP